MKFDCVIIGGGLAGLTAGIRCRQAGLNTAVITTGMSALHFSSGSIDLLSYDKNRKMIPKPYEALAGFIKENPNHPFAKIGLADIAKAMDFFQEELHRGGLTLNFKTQNGKENHFHITALGSLKATYLSGVSVLSDKILSAMRSSRPMAILKFEDYRDFYPGIVKANLKKFAEFSKKEIRTGSVKVSHKMLQSGNSKGEEANAKNIYEFRSVDYARVFSHKENLEILSGEINTLAPDSDLVCIPAFLCIHHFDDYHTYLEELTGKAIYEISALPPSIPGMRIDEALKKRFMETGGILITGQKIIGAEVAKERVLKVFSEDKNEFTADEFILAGGSFFSGGLKSEYQKIFEPIFDLKLKTDVKERSSYDFFDKRSHGFLAYGIDTDEEFRPKANSGATLKNLRCAGAVLSDYNPVLEGSGGGVAISTGFRIAERISKN